MKILPIMSTVFDVKKLIDADLPKELIGATIIEIGMPIEHDQSYEGGGLAIKLKTQDGIEKLIIFEFNDCGIISYEWIY